MKRSKSLSKRTLNCTEKKSHRKSYVYTCRRNRIVDNIQGKTVKSHRVNESQ